MRVSLDIFSDPICPWCLIGKTRLDRAEIEASEPIFARSWRVFQLNPHMPDEGVDRRAYLEAKFGGPEGARRIYGSIEETAEAEGLGLRFDLIKRTPATRNAHRVIKWAGPLNGQDAVMEALFDFYFRKGADISDRDVLAEAGAAGGLEREETLRLLDGPAEVDEVAKEDEAARAAGINGAPTFIIAGQHAAPGAIGTDMWLRVIGEVQQQITSASSR